MSYLFVTYLFLTCGIFGYVLFRFVMKKIPVGSTLYGSPRFSEEINPYKDQIYVVCFVGSLMNIIFYKKFLWMFPEYGTAVMAASILVAIIFVFSMEYTFKMKTPEKLAKAYGLHTREIIIPVTAKFERPNITQEKATTIFKEYVLEKKLLAASPAQFDSLFNLQLLDVKIKLVQISPSKKNALNKAGLLEFVDLIFDFKATNIGRDSVLHFCNSNFDFSTDLKGAKQEMTPKNYDDYIFKKRFGKLS